MAIKPLFRDKNFVLFFAVATLAVFVVFSSLSRTYESKISLLISPKSQVATEGLDRIMENARLLPLQLSFYDRMLFDNDNLDDESEALPAFRREEFWKKKISTRVVGKSGILEISVRDSDQFQTEDLSSQTGITLASYLSYFYNVKDDIDVRIVDGPIVRQTFKYGFWPLLVFSFIFGFFLSLILVRIFSEISSVRKKAEKISLPFSLPEILKRKDYVEPEWMEEIRLAGARKKEEENEEKFPEKTEQNILNYEKSRKKETLSLEKRSYAPDNLPVADEEFLASVMGTAEISEEKKEEEKKVEEVPAEVLKREATPEEIKERLNRLLRGEI